MNENTQVSTKTSPEDQVLRLLAEIATKRSQPTQSTSGVSIEHEGTKIKLPALPTHMSPGEAAEHLNRLDEMENQTVNIHEEIAAFPLDGALALSKAMMRMFGWATPQPQMSFFGPRPPQTVTFETGVGQKTTVIWGQFTLPGIEGEIKCGAEQNSEGEFQFVIRGEVIRKQLPLISELADMTRVIVSTESVYKGKAIRVRLGSSGKLDASQPPAFLDLRQKDPLILPPLVQSAVEANVFAPVERSEACRRAGIPLKRGVVLVGPPGTGKTLTAQVLAKKCVDNGWTYILVNDVAALPATLSFAKRYAPCVLFCEDIDHGTSGPRDAKLNVLLNTMDGIASKHAEIMTVFTSNDTSKIDRTLVRPGRIDAIIEFPAPQDSGTIAAFIRHYGFGRVREDEDLTKSCLELEGAIPAVIREAVERAKLYALSRGVDPDVMTVTDEDICAAAATMKNHVDFLKSKRDAAKSPEEVLGEAFTRLHQQAFAAHLADIKTQMDEAIQQLQSLRR